MAIYIDENITKIVKLSHRGFPHLVQNRKSICTRNIWCMQYFVWLTSTSLSWCNMHKLVRHKHSSSNASSSRINQRLDTRLEELFIFKISFWNLGFLGFSFKQQLLKRTYPSCKTLWKLFLCFGGGGGGGGVAEIKMSSILKLAKNAAFTYLSLTEPKIWILH